MNVPVGMFYILSNEINFNLGSCIGKYCVKGSTNIFQTHPTFLHIEIYS